MAFKLITFSCLLAFVSSAHIEVESRSIENLLVNGRNATRGEFPYIVSVQWGDPPAKRVSHVCAGAIISEKWVLTAAQCARKLTDKGLAVVRAGKHNLTEFEDTEQNIEIISTHVHEKYTNASPANSFTQYDIALLQLKTPLKFPNNRNVQVIKLPVEGSTPTGITTLSGWGSTKNNSELSSTLQTIALVSIDTTTCKILLGTKINDTHLCSKPNPERSPCTNDLGSPLMAQKGSTKELVGIFSWVESPCGRTDYPGVFVNVSYFAKWIEDTMKKNESKPKPNTE